METILSRYARLLVEYCLELQPGDRLLIRTTPSPNLSSGKFSGTHYAPAPT